MDERSSQTRRGCVDSCSVRLMAAVFLLIAAAGWLRMYEALARWYWLETSGVQPGPLYFVLTGALWGAAGVAGFFWLVYGVRWGRLVGAAVVVFCLLTYWADRILFTRAPDAWSNTAFALLASLLGLLAAAVMLRPDHDLRHPTAASAAPAAHAEPTDPLA